MGSNLLRTPTLQEMSEKERLVQSESGNRRGENKVCCGENAVWHLRLIQYHVLVML